MRTEVSSVAISLLPIPSHQTLMIYCISKPQFGEALKFQWKIDHSFAVLRTKKKLSDRRGRGWGFFVTLTAVFSEPLSLVIVIWFIVCIYRCQTVDCIVKTPLFAHFVGAVARNGGAKYNWDATKWKQRNELPIWKADASFSHSVE